VRKGSGARAPGRGGRAARRVLRILLLLSVLGGAGFFAWRETAEPVRAALRDYLAQRRVDRHAEVLRAAARESGVDPCLLAALMIAESSGRVNARSPTGALGLFQLTPVSARWRAEVLGLPPPTEEDLLSDALLSARLGADNLAWLLDTYDGDVERALCAYNAGARRLKEIVTPEGGWEAWRARHERAGDSRLLAYAHRVLRLRDELRARGFFAEFYPPAGTPATDAPAGAPTGGSPAALEGAGGGLPAPNAGG
jgi:soluble lytic murein transglycosylase-like protein